MSQRSFAVLYRMLSGFLALCLLSADLAGVAALIDIQLPSSPALREGLGEGLPPAQQALFRVTVTLRQPRDLSRVRELGAVVLSADGSSALLLATAPQLADLARLRFEPTATDELSVLLTGNGATGLLAELGPVLEQAAGVSRQWVSGSVGQSVSGPVDQSAAELAGLLASITPQQQAAIAPLAPVDTDSDGLTDTQEGWWCTDAARPDTDFDGANDGAEVNAAKAWLGNTAASYPSTGKPFQGWPPQITGCFDDDLDSVPDLAEVLDLGLNNNLESTDRDKFDDGQELFGNTYCTGQGGFCSYGQLPRNADWGTIFSQMPSWVERPGNHPFAAAFPIPEIDIADNSLKVEAVTTIEAGHTIASGTQRSYSTTTTEGTSDSVANSTTWNEWEESSEAYEQPVNGPQETANDVQPADVANCGIIDKLQGQCRTIHDKTLQGRDATSCWSTNTNLGWNFGGSLGWDLGPKAELNGGIEGGTSHDQLGPLDIGCQAYVGRRLAAMPPGQLEELKKNLAVYRETLDGQRIDSPATTGAGQTIVNNNIDTNALVGGLEGIQLATTQAGQMIATQLMQVSAAISQPRLTTTETTGKSRGGSQTIEHTTYEEHSVTNGEAFTTEEGWSNATAVNSARAAELWFSYKVSNNGAEYAREICNLAFNLYIGDDSNPAATYFVANDLGGSGCFANFMPNAERTFTSARIPLSLAQMKAIDTGQPFRIEVEDFAYGIDQLFYEDAIKAGIVFALEDGQDDGNETIDSYVLPTWGDETVLDVMARYFPHQTDAYGDLKAVWTPEYRSDTPAWCIEPRALGTGSNRTLWCKHILSTADWWNVFTDGLGTGTEGFQDTPASAGGMALFRFNQDTDRDGYSDRSERRLLTDANDPTDYPHPELVGGVHSIRSGNTVNATLSLLNAGTYDAYAVRAVLVAPDDSITVTDNTVGGAGRVRNQRSVIVGSRVMPPAYTTTTWTGTAVPQAGGYFTGSTARTYTFTVACATPGGCEVGSGSWTLNWSDGAGGDPDGSLNFGAGYATPTFLDVGTMGVQVALVSGAANNGDRFTVEARPPLDTFTYTVNREPYTPPLVLVSYNDQRGNHRFAIPAEAMALSSPAADLVGWGGMMLVEPGVAIATTEPFEPGANSFTLVANNPSPYTLADAHFYVEFINLEGQVVHQMPLTVDLPPGPNIVPVNWNSTAFNPALQEGQDYIVMAFWTDYQNNILDTAARPLSSFQEDGVAVLEIKPESLTWNFGAAKQGTLLQRPLLIGNTGRQALLLRAGAANGAALVGPQTVEAGGLGAYTLALDTTPLAVGPYSAQVTIRTSDPANPTVTVNVSGTIEAGTGDTGQGGIQRPLDWPLSVPGPRSAGEWVVYNHNLGPDPVVLHPVRVYSEDYSTLLGTGNYATDFAAGIGPSFMFGDGRDGVMPASGNLDNDNGAAYGSVSGLAGSTSVTVVDQVHIGRINPGDVVLIHQSQYTGAGDWELNRAVSDFIGSGTFTLQKPLEHTYSTGAQILRVPQYSTCNVTGTISPIWNWNGTVGGIVAVMCNGAFNISGTVDVFGAGFRGGREQLGYSHLGGEGGEGINGISGHGGGGSPPYSGTPPGGGGRTMDHVNPPAGPGPSTGGAGGGYTFGVQRDEGGGGGGGGGYVFGGGGGGGGSDSGHPGGNGGVANSATGGGGGGGAGGDRGGTGGNSGQNGESRRGGGGAGGSTGQTGGGGAGVNNTREAGGGGGGGGGNFTSDNLLSMVFGSGGGGGGGHETWNETGGAGGSGAGIVMLFVRDLTVSGNMRAEGYPGETRYAGGGGGGGAGGSILVRTQIGDIGINRLTAAGATGGDPAFGGMGGSGSVGRIRVEYCNSLTGTPATVAEVVQIDCHIAEQVETAPYTQGRLNIPEAYTDEARAYAIQYGLHFLYGAAGEQGSYLRVPAGVFNSATLHALVSGVGSGDVTVKLDVGNDGTWDWQATQAVSNAADLASPDLATAFNAYWTSHGAPSSGNVDVPVRVYLSKPGQVLLTDLQMTGGGSSLRYVRLPATTYGSVALDLAVAGSGSGPLTLAADVGDDGTVDWSTSNSGPFPRALTSGDLSAAVNAYLTGKSGDVDVPVRLTYTPFNGITISRAAATPAARPDGSIANADVSLTQTNLTEGDTTTVNATVRSNGAAVDGVTVGFFASLPNGLDWYLGSRYLAAVSPSGTATSLVWDTTGFSGATTVKVIIDPYNALAETNEANNQGTKAATIKTRPNLRPTAIVPATFAPVAGEALTVEVTIHNSGQTPSAAAVCALYLGNPDDGGALIGSQACGPLGANTSVTLTFPWTPVAAGPARLFARADSGGALIEPDEFDNDRWLDLEVTAPGPMPPYTPSNPNPADAATGVAMATTLSWTGGDPNPGDTLTYEVYFGTANPPTAKVMTQSATSYDPPGDLAQNTTYYWQIIAKDNTNRTTSGPVWRFTTVTPPNNPPTAPSDPNPANGATAISKAVGQVCWAASTDADGDPVTYDVAFGTSNPPAPVASGQSGTCYSTGALAGHTTHYWQVTARDNRGGSTPGPVWQFTTANTAPTAPSNPNPANGATGVATNTQVCWTAGADGDGDPVTYDVAFGTTNPPPAATSGQSAACYDPPGDLTAGTLYYWKVTAKDAFGGTTAGSMWSFTTAALPNNPPNAPTNPSPAPGVTGVALTAALSWSGSDPENDPLTYEVRFGTANPPPTVVAGQSVTTYDPPGNLAAHTTYYWQIVAKDAAHPAGTAGPVWSFTTANTAPSAPTSPNPANGTTGVATSAQVCWTAASDPDGDAVTYDVAFGATNPPPAATSGQSATCYDPPGDMTAGTPYYWKVTAKDAFGGSTAGTQWSFTTTGGPIFPDVFYLSPSANVTVGGIAAQGADVLRYTKSANLWEKVFDGSDHGLTKNISAFSLTDDGRLLFVLVANQAIAGLGTATPFDVVQFTPNAPGVYPLGAGTFSIFFQGQLKGLTAAGEKIDAIDLSGNRLLLSTGGAASVSLASGAVLKAADEDVFVFDRGANQWESALLIDGSKMTGMAAEDISGVWDDPATGDYYITIVGAFNLGGVKGNDKSIVKLSPNGGATVYTPSLVNWLAAGATFAGKLDGLELTR